MLGKIFKEKPSVKSLYVYSALLPMTIMLVVWLFMGVFPFGDKTLMAVDFGQQYIGLYGFLKETILTGDFSGFFHSFSKSLGGAMIGIWGFNLISPFNILYVILPLSAFNWAITLTIWLRYGAFGLSFAYFLIKRYNGASKRPYFVPLFAAAYALSGMIVSYQMNPIFYDAMYMLPLVITYLEEVIDGNRPFKYIISLAVTMILHFYMGYMIALFVAMYTVYYAVIQTHADTAKAQSIAVAKKVGQVFLYSVAAIGSVLFFLMPIVFNLLLSKGAYDSGLKWTWDLQINPMDILSKFMIGAFDNQSWPSGPNLPNVYIGAVALIGCVLFFGVTHITRKERIAAGIILFVYLLACVHDFTNKVFHMSQTPAGFFYRFTWILSFFMVFLAYKAFIDFDKLSKKAFVIGTIASVIITDFVMGSTHSFLLRLDAKLPTTQTQIYSLLAALLIGLTILFVFILKFGKPTPKEKRVVLIGYAILSVVLIGAALRGVLITQEMLTFLTWMIVLGALYAVPTKGIWIALGIMTALELGVNAYISQVRIGYDPAAKFADVQTTLSEAAQKIKEKDPMTDFYRVNSMFLYAKNDPFMYDYNGTSNFSSNMERATLNLFGRLGTMGGNASTYHSASTLLSDALFGIKYYIDAKPYTNEQGSDKTKRYFQRQSTRIDLDVNYAKVIDLPRYEIFENPYALAIGFGVDDQFIHAPLKEHKPAVNQNTILQKMTHTDANFLQSFAFEEIVLENVKGDSDKPENRMYTRVDKTKAGKITFKFVPRTMNTYYVTAPMSLRRSKGEIGVKLNGRWYEYTQSYDQVQLWQIAHQQTAPITFEISFDKTDKIDLTGLELIRQDDEAVIHALKEQKKHNMVVTSWGNNYINGTVTIAPNNTHLMTSIPYNPSWQAKIDGKDVTPVDAWEGFLAIPMAPGEHTVELVFIPQGFWVGTILSILTIAGLVIWFMYPKMKSRSV